MLPFIQNYSLNHWFIKNVSFEFSTATDTWDSLTNKIGKELSAPLWSLSWSFPSWLFGKCILKCTVHVRFMDSAVLPCEQCCLLSLAESLAPLLSCWLSFVIRMTRLLWRQPELGRFLSTHFCWSRNTWSRGSLLIWKAEVSFWRHSVLSLLSVAKLIVPQLFFSKTPCDLEMNLPLFTKWMQTFLVRTVIQKKYDHDISKPVKVYQLYMPSISRRTTLSALTFWIRKILLLPMEKALLPG